MTEQLKIDELTIQQFIHQNMFEDQFMNLVGMILPKKKNIQFNIKPKNGGKNYCNRGTEG